MERTLEAHKVQVSLTIQRGKQELLARFFSTSLEIYLMGYVGRIILFLDRER
jgi:hypothetical protein